MIEEHRITDNNGRTYRIFKGKDVEKISPIEYYSKVFTIPRIAIERDLLLNQFPPSEFLDNFLSKRAAKEWENKYKDILSVEVPSNFLKLLEAKSKKDQVKLLRNQSINPDQLVAFIIKSFLNSGYLFSEYQAEHMHNGIENELLPKMAHSEGDEINKVGETTLSEGQLKQLIKHRKVIVAKFLDNENDWHCFFLTYKSLRREENWQNGQPHLHYISSKFGLSRQEVVTNLKSKYYNLGNLPHIALDRYR